MARAAGAACADALRPADHVGPCPAGTQLALLGPRTHQGALQWALVASGPVVWPLCLLRVDVPQVQLLHQPGAGGRLRLQVALHTDQAELVHGEAQGGGAVPLGPRAQQLIQRPGQPGPGGGQAPGAVLAGPGPVEASGDIEQGAAAVEDDAHLVQVVVGLGGASGDPGGPAQAHLALDEQGVGGLAAQGVSVVELVGSEEAVGEEGVGAGEELGPRAHLAAVGAERRVGRVAAAGRVPLPLGWAPQPRFP